MRSRIKDPFAWIVALIVMMLVSIAIFNTKPPAENIVHTSDTIRITEFVPAKVEPTRKDTTFSKDSVPCEIEVEQKTYENENYKAVVEGYKAELTYLELYNKNTIIRDTTWINNVTTKTIYKPPRWVLSIGPGIGYSPKGFEPFVGVSLGFVIWSK